MSRVDQPTIRRRGIGLRAYDPERAYDGYTLFTPMSGDGTVYLIDMRGETAHTWTLPHPPGLYGYLLDTGNLFYGGKPVDQLEKLPPWMRGFKAGSASRSRRHRRGPGRERQAHGRARWTGRGAPQM